MNHNDSTEGGSIDPKEMDNRTQAFLRVCKFCADKLVLAQDG